MRRDPRRPSRTESQESPPRPRFCPHPRTRVASTQQPAEIARSGAILRASRPCRGRLIHTLDQLAAPRRPRQKASPHGRDCVSSRTGVMSERRRLSDEWISRSGGSPTWLFAFGADRGPVARDVNSVGPMTAGRAASRVLSRGGERRGGSTVVPMPGWASRPIVPVLLVRCAGVVRRPAIAGARFWMLLRSGTSVLVVTVLVVVLYRPPAKCVRRLNYRRRGVGRWGRTRQ